jgi:hemoglobin
MTEADTAILSRTPFEMIGGAGVVRAIVDRFYDLMEQDDRYADLRALHAPDLAPMRDSLAGFLTAWLGGPRDWFAQRPGACIMSAHGRLAIEATTADQWIVAMTRAIVESGVDFNLGRRMSDALGGMARAMAR